MVTAHFRFVGDLNCFLPRQHGHSEFACVCARAATVKHMIEALGVPHTEVTSVLANGELCGFGRLLREGDRMLVNGATALRHADGKLSTPGGLPAAVPRFIADAHMGGLARMLRMAGFDTLYGSNFEDAHIAQQAAAEDRIVLTRDRDLLKRRLVRRGCFVHALKTMAQFTEIAERLHLQPLAQPFTLCLHCNTPLRSVPWEKVEAALPPAVRAAHTTFQTCDSCRLVFWKGSHWARMCAALAAAGMSGHGEVSRS